MRLTNWLVKAKTVLLLAAFVLLQAPNLFAQNVLYYVDYTVGSDLMAQALTARGYTVTTVTDNTTFQTDIAVPGAYQLAIYYSQNNAANGTSAAALATFYNNGGKTIYFDYYAQSSLSTPLGATYTGSYNNTSVTVTDPALTPSLSSNPLTLTNTGWGIFATGLATTGGSTSSATFGDGSVAITKTADGRSIVLGFASDVLPDDQLFFNLLGPVSVINTSAVSGSPFCPGASLNVSFTSSNVTYNAGNVFTAQLSDAAGSFASPTAIGTLTSNATSGTINCVIPAATPGGTAYRIRVVSSNPAVTGGDNGSNLTINPQPVAAFTAGTSCATNATQFTNGSTIATGTITAYHYDFGDGSVSLIASPSYIYSASGSHNVTLIVTSDQGCTDTVVQNVITNSTPTASFTNNTPCLGVATNFTSTSTGAATYAWTFGDGATGTGVTPSHTYAAPGTYTVTLIASSSFGCTDTATANITVNPLPVADFDAGSACVSNAITFTNLSSISSGTLTYNWAFGDAGSSTATSPSHTYAAAGVYNVTLTATSGNGCTATVTKSVSVFPRPTVAFTSTTVCQGQATAFTNNSTSAAGTLTYLWNFGDGTTSNNPTPTHTYAASGSYSVKLLAQTSNGCIDSITNTVTVNATSVASFTASTACLGTATTFTNNSTGATTYAWSFGDGGTSTATAPTYTYAAPGTYTVSLVASNANGCSSTATSVVTVNPTPVPDFTATNACLGNNVTFTNLSSISSGTLTYSWAFGDAGTSTATSPTHSYVTAGSFNVTLTATSGNSCSATISKPVTVYARPTVAFTATTPCLGTAMAFTNSSSTTSGSLTYAWTFGDGGTSSNPSPTHTYATSGTFSVKLVATTSNGCKDSVTNTVTVNPNPVAGFTVTNNCLGAATNFTNTSTGASNFAWDFGDGQTANTSTATHTYAAAGTYTVTLTATSASNCTNTVSHVVTINPIPVPDFNANAACPNNNITFTNLSSVSSGTLTYQWGFGDAGTSTATSPTHAYTAAGTYNVTLTATSGNGCTASVTKPVTVYPRPAVAFSATTVCLGNPTTFTNSSTSASGSLTYAWRFGDGGTSSNPTPTHTYATSGTFTVVLVATTSNGCVDSATNIITVNAVPVAGFTVSNNCLGVATNFTNTSTGASTYNWNFGDGQTATGSTATHTYGAPGTYTAVLIATNGNGCSDTDSHVITINPLPVADFSATSACPNNAIAFTNLSSISSGTLTYSWGFGDAGTSTATSPTHTYTASGSYNVTLTATSGNGCTATVTKPVTVYPLPVVAFTATTVCQGTATSFTNNSTTSTGSLTYAWDFGDGGTSTNPAPSHVYATAGTFTVKLVATSNYGCKDSVTNTVTVNANPVAGFTVSNNCLGVATSFTNTSTGASTFTWDFGDGSTSTGSTASHTYAAPGNYTVTLTAGNVNNCTNTVSHIVTIYPLPVANFDAVGACPNNPVVFTNLSSISSGTMTYAWGFGDAATSTATSPTHSYVSSGIYNATLTVTSGNGCTATITKPVEVYEVPVPDFVANNVCDGQTMHFTNATTIGNGSATYKWYFGDGDTSTDNNPSHLYAGPGIYTVTLIAYSNHGCSDSISNTVEVYQQPVSSFTVSASSICLGDSITFTNTSTTGANISYAWTFGDGTTSSLTSPTHTYTTSGTFVVTLTVANVFTGCTDTSSTTVVVFPQPAANFTATTVCQGTATQFTNTSVISTGTLSYIWDFGDGASSTDINPSHIYAAAGTYSVKLFATSNNGCQDTVRHTVTVNVQPHVAFSAVSAAVCDRVAVEFVNNSTGSANSLTTWYYGDGATSNDPAAPNHLYAGPGTYTVSLSVRDTVTGCSDSASITVIVHPRPVAVFAGQDVCLGTAVQFTNSSTISTGTMTYSWDFGDTTSSIDINPSHLYASIGIKNVTLVVTSNNGCSDTVAHSLIINPLPVADFSAGNACFDAPVQFTNLTTIAFGTATYHWAFGDGTTDTAANPSHVYPALGTYTITLTATSNAGCTDVVTKSITIHPNPTANFLAQNACVDNAINFTNLSSASSGSYTSFWQFGDGLTSIDKDPAYIYHTDGNYQVTLTVTSNFGCVDSITRTVTAYPKPTVAFTWTDVCIGEAMNFHNNTTVSGATISGYQWFFGDGDYSAAPQPSHLYALPGTYRVTLVATSSLGCIDSVSNVVIVHGLPNAEIRALGPTSFCDGDSVTLSAGLTGTDFYHWSTGDRTQNITVKESDLYHVTVTSQFGCQDSDTISVTKWLLPNADAGNDTLISKGYLAHLHGSGGVSYVWTPSETIDYPNAQNPDAKPLTTTTFTVLVTDSNGCQASDSVVVNVIEDYNVMFTNTFTPNGDGKNDFWVIINIETYPNCEVLIFDAYGNRVFESKAYNNDWDGTYNGKELPEGTYYYVVRFDGVDKLFKGAVSILR